MTEINFNEILAKIPAWGLFVLVLVGLISYFYKDSISEIIKDFKNIKRKKKIENLSHHDFFNTVSFVKNEIMRIQFITHGENDLVKTKLLQHLISLKTKEITERFSEFLKLEDLNNCESQDLKSLVKKTLIEIVTAYTTQAHKDYIRLGISNEDAQFTIDSYENYRKEIVSGFMERVDSISTNNDYYSNYDKMSAILEVVAISLYIIPKDVKNAFDLINGRFKKYKDLKLELLDN